MKHINFSPPADCGEIVEVEGIHGCLDSNGTAWLSLYDVAFKLGFTRIKDDVEYIIWDRVRQYLREFGYPPKTRKSNAKTWRNNANPPQVGKTEGFSPENPAEVWRNNALSTQVWKTEGFFPENPPQVGKTDFIPENIFYRLAMKANNAAANAFQSKVADIIIPSIRKHGFYVADNVKVEQETKPAPVKSIKFSKSRVRLLLDVADRADNPLKDQILREAANIIVGKKLF